MTEHEQGIFLTNHHKLPTKEQLVRAEREYKDIQIIQECNLFFRCEMPANRDDAYQYYLRVTQRMIDAAVAACSHTVYEWTDNKVYNDNTHTWELITYRECISCATCTSFRNS